MEQAVSTQKRKIRWFEMVFFLFFVLGIILANLFKESQMNQYGVINSYFIQQLKYIEIRGGDFLVYIISKRIPLLVFLCVLGMTALCRTVHGCFLAWAGFSLGFLCVAAIRNMGAGAVGLIMLSLFPHYLFYGAGYGILLHMQRQYQEDLRKRPRLEWCAVWGVVAMLFLLGMLSEAYINPPLC
ncbi:MAG: stage II sporulation protein M, partial [Lachnospiraceae bacterium]|nr:stage II sporulation protein M [Lachnospiraceae bacterium]